MLILLNKKANGLRNLKKWNLIKKYLDRQNISYHFAITKTLQEAENVIKKYISNQEEPTVIATGGDGTVNCILNILIKNKYHLPPYSVKFGAIGLGSSNDFHKPRKNYKVIHKIPLRINNTKTQFVDVGKTIFYDSNNNKKEHYFIINASVGAMAEANNYFNINKFIGLLKRINVDFAFFYTTIAYLIKYKKTIGSIDIDNTMKISNLKITNLHVLKNVHFAGNLFYDTPVKAADGFFDINLSENMSRIEAIQTLISLSKGKFIGLAKTKFWRGKNFEISLQKEANLELDGEIYKIKKATFQLIPKAIKVCF